MKFLEGKKTYLSIFFSILASVATLVGWDLSEFLKLENEVWAIIAAVAAVFGRYVAKPEPKTEAKK